MKKHPFVLGMFIGFTVIFILSAVILFRYPQLLFMYKEIDKFFMR